MKRFFSAVLLCGSMLAVGSVYFLRSAEAKENIVIGMLELPAPPPHHPLAPVRSARSDDFYRKSNPPPDDAPIDDLLEYWARQGISWGDLRYNIKPSPRVMGRLIAEVRANPEQAGRFLNVFRDDEDGARLIKDIYDGYAAGTAEEREESRMLREWLVNNTPHFADELEQRARGIQEDREYTTGHDELLALAKQDWDRAAPIVNRLYNDTSQPSTRVAAIWALYKHAIQEGSIGDTDRYREELMKIVEDRTATNGMRDLALDALVAEKEWAGRDEWYFSLLGDETLANLVVNGSPNTGLTTLIMNSPVEKYKDRMIELAKSDNKTIKNAAVRNLIVMLREGRDEAIVKALLPWLGDPSWAADNGGGGRNTIVQALSEYKLPDSVPGLIHLLTEKPPRPSNANSSVNTRSTSNMNAWTPPANMDPETANSVMAAVRSAMNAANSAATYYNEDYYPLRYSALSALTNQADIRAVPALRRLLATTANYERMSVINALIASGGFTVPEQVDALVAVVRSEPMSLESYANAAAISAVNGNYSPPPQLSIQEAIGTQLRAMEKVPEDTVRAVIERMDSLERRDPMTANGLRRVVQGWNGPAVNMMMLRDLKNGKSNTDAVVKILGMRKELREKQPSDVFDLRTGDPVAIGLAGCILEDSNDMASLLNSGNSTATAAMLACARLLRAQLPVASVIPLLRSPEPDLARSAESYLISEDSPEARTAVLSIHPNKALILGATTSFGGDGGDKFSDPLGILFASVSPYYAGSEYAGQAFYSTDFSAVEKRFQEEVIGDKDLLGVYSYENFNVRIYTDRTLFSIQEDEARYRERALTTEEFDYLKGLLSYHKVDEQRPYLACDSCEGRQLLMLGRNGGRRVYVKANRMPELFAGLDSYFADLSRTPLKLKYAASKELPGLEVLFAEDGMFAETVWRTGTETRLLITNRATRERVKQEIFKAIEEAAEAAEPPNSETGRYMQPYLLGQQLRAKREFEGIDWFALGNERLAGQVPAPPGFDLPPVRDGLSVPPAFERWKARVGDVEIRADTDGLYKVSGGAITKIKSGYYSYPLLTPNGRWVVVNKYDDEGSGLFRIDLRTGRESKIDLSEQGADMGIVFIPSVNRFLLGSMVYSDEHDYGGEDEEVEEPFARPVYKPSTFLLLDPDTGLFRDAPGQYVPLTHQTFRQLQPAGKPNEYWAAMPDEDANLTVVGIYNAAVFGFKPVMKVPKIIFDSLDMWVDQGKIYFVYRGHLLAAPLPAG